MGSRNGSSQAGSRPVLIISNDVGNHFAQTVIIAPLTAKKKNMKMPTHIEIEHEALHKKSTILLEQIKTIDKEHLGNRICMLPPEIKPKVKNSIKKSLNL